MLNNYFNLQLTEEQLIEFALLLGSDCPFFIINAASIGTGRGEILERIPLNLKGYKILIVNPGVHVATKWAFEQITPCKKEKSITDIVLQPISTWKSELINDFEEPISKAHPEILSIKRELYSKGAIYASMTGSGSTVFGIFGQLNASLFSFPKNYMTKVTEIL